MRVDVDVSEVLGAIKSTLDELRDQTDIWTDVGYEVMNSVSRNFEAQGRPKKWQPLARSTLLAKVGGVRNATTKRGGHWKAKAKKTLHGNKILTDTGQLRRSINAEPDATGVTVGTNMVYGAIHQFGGRAGRGRKVVIPARPYLLLQDDDYRKIAAIIERHLTKRW